MTHSTFRIVTDENSNRDLILMFAKSIQKIGKESNKPAVVTRLAQPA